MNSVKKHLISTASFIGQGARFILLLLISFLIATLPLDHSQAKVSSSEVFEPPIDVEALARFNHLTLSGREPRTLSVDDAVRIINSGRATLVETQTQKQYDRAHIAGSINLPRVDRKAIAQLAEKKPVLVFCDYQEQCELDLKARGILSTCKLSASMMADQLGYENVALVESSYMLLKRKGVKFYFGRNSRPKRG